MTRADFAPLRAAFADCRSDGLLVPIWWRDDDACAPTPALDRLQDLAGRTGAPVHIAVIPGLAKSDLPGTLNQAYTVPVVHGWQHTNHSPAGSKRAEFGHPRANAKAELAQALARARQLFSHRLFPMFVPPWNRIAEAHAALLPTLGYRYLSAFGPRAMGQTFRINTHVDPIDWRGSRDLVDPNALIDATVTRLRNRLKGVEDRQEPLGLLTHHLVHSPAIWDFSERWISECLDAGAAVWTTTTGDENEPT